MQSSNNNNFEFHFEQWATQFYSINLRASVCVRRRAKNDNEMSLTLTMVQSVQTTGWVWTALERAIYIIPFLTNES